MLFTFFEKSFRLCNRFALANTFSLIGLILVPNLVVTDGLTTVLKMVSGFHVDPIGRITFFS